MTIHISNNWKLLDNPIDECPTDEIVSAIEYHGRRLPMAYGIFSDADNLVYNISRIIDGRSTPITDAEIENFIQDLPDDVKARYCIIIIRVLKKLELYAGEKDIGDAESKLESQETGDSS